MPILIDELSAEIQSEARPATEANPAQLRAPMSDPEYELSKTLALLEERNNRLLVD